MNAIASAFARSRSQAIPVRGVPLRRNDRETPNIYTFQIQNQAIIIQDTLSVWSEVVIARLDDLVKLEVGWDGYRGQPVSFSCACFAVSLLDRVCSARTAAPSIVPGSDGTLQLEWHQNGYDVEVDILAPNKVRAMRYNIETGETEEVDLQNNFAVVRNWIDELGEG